MRGGDDDLLNPAERNLIGYACFTIAEIVSAPTKYVARQLANDLKPNRLNGVLEVHGEEPIHVGCRVSFQIRVGALPDAKGLVGGKPDPYCLISKASSADPSSSSSTAVSSDTSSTSPRVDKRRSHSPLGKISHAIRTRREQRKSPSTEAGQTPYAINRDNWTPVWRTEVAKKSRDVDFRPVSATMQQLCNADNDRELLFEVYDYHAHSKHDLIGACRTTFSAIRDGQRVFQLVNEDEMLKARAKKKTYTNSGMLELLSYKLSREPSFMEYVLGGCEISLLVGIDFTSSNGPPSHPQSLHRQAAGEMNEYEHAIVSVCNVLEPYDTDNIIPAFGFGAEIDGELSHCFPLRSDGEPCVGVAGVLAAYRDALSRVALSGPTVFSDIIRAATTAAIAEAKQKQTYTVLLLLTDGVLDEDLEPTLEAVVAASGAAISIVIVGVGRADFTDMDRIDSDSQLIVAPRSGRKAVRDAVQFVPYRDYKQHPQLLAREVLYELPRQFLEYCHLSRWQPKPPQLIVDGDDAGFIFPSAGGGVSAAAAAPTLMPPIVPMPISSFPVMTIESAAPTPLYGNETTDLLAEFARLAIPTTSEPSAAVDALPSVPSDVPDVPDFDDDDDDAVNTATTAGTSSGKFESCSECQERPLSAVFLPCGHMVMCFECGKLHQKAKKVCPVDQCRAAVERVIES
jgi:hypothetical protein